MASVTPSQAELDNFSAAANKLWALDENRLTPGTDYALNIQVRILLAGGLLAEKLCCCGCSRAEAIEATER
jgi:hypothetical protein